MRAFKWNVCGRLVAIGERVEERRERLSQYVRVQIWRWGWDDGGDGVIFVVGVGNGVGREG
jgi:hypothetical protein